MTPLLTRIRAKCIEANPRVCSNCQWRETEGEHALTRIGRTYCKKFAPRTIHLADVLLAIKMFSTKTRARRETDVLRLCCDKWNLHEDDLEKQSPETLQFLGEILGV